MVSSACCGEIKAPALLDLEAGLLRRALAARVARHRLEAIRAGFERLAAHLDVPVEAARAGFVGALEAADRHVAGALLGAVRRLLGRLHARLAALDAGRGLEDRERRLRRSVEAVAHLSPGRRRERLRLQLQLAHDRDRRAHGPPPPT